MYVWLVRRGGCGAPGKTQANQAIPSLGGTARAAARRGVLGTLVPDAVVHVVGVEEDGEVR